MTTTSTHTNGEFGTWTEAFSQLHDAAISGASAEEIRRLETAELHQHGGRS